MVRSGLEMIFHVNIRSIERFFHWCGCHTPVLMFTWAYYEDCVTDMSRYINTWKAPQHAISRGVDRLAIVYYDICSYSCHPLIVYTPGGRMLCLKQLLHHKTFHTYCQSVCRDIRSAHLVVAQFWATFEGWNWSIIRPLNTFLLKQPESFSHWSNCDCR